MSKSNYLENEVLKWSTGQPGVFGPGVNGPYLALYTAPPTDAGGGIEVFGGGYARLNSDGKWSSPNNTGSVFNTAEISYNTASAPWGIIVAVGLFDAIGGGNLLYWGVTPNIVVGTNETARFLVGALTLSEE